jgi:ankyrin repeat protein
MASQNGHIDVVRSLLAAGADPRLARRNGFTALDAAKHKKHTQSVALLEAIACSNLLISKGASADSSTMVTCNADSGSLYGMLYHYPAGFAHELKRP